MELRVNGQQRHFDDVGEVFTVAQLLDALGLANRRVAVEVNRKIVKRATYNEASLSEGDAVEIVHFVGGG